MQHRPRWRRSRVSVGGPRRCTFDGPGATDVWPDRRHRSRHRDAGRKDSHPAGPGDAGSGSARRGDRGGRRRAPVPATTSRSAGAGRAARPPAKRGCDALQRGLAPRFRPVVRILDTGLSRPDGSSRGPSAGPCRWAGPRSSIRRGRARPYRRPPRRCVSRDSPFRDVSVWLDSPASVPSTVRPRSALCSRWSSRSRSAVSSSRRSRARRDPPSSGRSSPSVVVDAGGSVGGVTAAGGSGPAELVTDVTPGGGGTGGIGGTTAGNGGMTGGIGGPTGGNGAPSDGIPGVGRAPRWRTARRGHHSSGAPRDPDGPGTDVGGDASPDDGNDGPDAPPTPTHPQPTSPPTAPPTPRPTPSPRRRRPRNPRRSPRRSHPPPTPDPTPDPTPTPEECLIDLPILPPVCP